MKTKMKQFDKEFGWITDFLEKYRKDIFVGINDFDYTGCDNFWKRFIDLGKKMEKTIETGNKYKKRLKL
jgi:hypothetical protein